MSLTISGITDGYGGAAYGSNSNASSVALTSKIIIYGFCNGSSTATSGIVSLLASSVPAVSTTNWTITMAIRGTGSSTSETYTIYYYGI
jgi:outer membrane scaffolding protein for murein synthesis (MipA/OmpV family)